MLRTSIAAVVLGRFYFCPLDFDASVMVVDCAAVETGCMLEKYIPGKSCNKRRGHFNFLAEVLLLLLLRRAAAAAHDISPEAERGNGYCFLLLRLRCYYCCVINVNSIAVAAVEKGCMPDKTKCIPFLFLLAALLLLFTHREGCAAKNKVVFRFLFDTGTQSVAVSVTRYVLMLNLTAPGSCLRHQY